MASVLSSKKPLVAVVGATGLQGGSVLRAVLNSGRYTVRGLTRDPTSERVRQLNDAYKHTPDLTWMRVDLNDPRSLQKAFDGADAVFAVTDFWTKEILAYPILEEMQGKAMVDAARAANVQHFLWSGLDDVETITKGKYECVHFTGKAHVTAYLQAFHGKMRWTELMPGNYMSFWTTMMAPQPDPAHPGTVVWRTPIKADTKLPLVDIEEDMGKVAMAVLDAGSELDGKRIEVCGGYITPQEIAETFTKVTGVPARYEALTPPVPNMTPEMQHMFAYFNEYGYYNGRDVDWVQRSIVKLNTWADYLKRTGYRPGKQ